MTESHQKGPILSKWREKNSFAQFLKKKNLVIKVDKDHSNVLNKCPLHKNRSRKVGHCDLRSTYVLIIITISNNLDRSDAPYQI